jgi:hypothetical protein
MNAFVNPATKDATKVITDFNAVDDTCCNEVTAIVEFSAYVPVIDKATVILKNGTDAFLEVRVDFSVTLDHSPDEGNGWDAPFAPAYSEVKRFEILSTWGTEYDDNQDVIFNGWVLLSDAALTSIEEFIVNELMGAT